MVVRWCLASRSSPCKLILTELPRLTPEAIMQALLKDGKQENRNGITPLVQSLQELPGAWMPECDVMSAKTEVGRAEEVMR